MKTEKVPFPIPAPTLDLHDLKATLKCDLDKYSNGSLMMTVAHCEITDSDTGEKLGSVNCEVMGRAVEVVIGNRHYHVPTKDIWQAVFEAEKRALGAHSVPQGV